MRAAEPPIVPSSEALTRYAKVLRVSAPVVKLLLRRWISNVEVVGAEHLSRVPAVVLMNHSNPFDPLVLTVFGGRPIQFLITEPAMQLGAPSKFLAWWGQVGKRKLDPDARAMRTLKGWTSAGGLAGLFPEGGFPWDGQPLKLQPGLKQLLTYLEVPVITARLYNGDRLWPAWARVPRRTKLRLEIDAPVTFGAGEDIERAVAERLRVDPERSWRAEVRGRDLALGLSKFLRLCVDCGADGALGESGDELWCSRCLSRWQVTTDNRLGSMTIAQVREKVHARFLAQLRKDGRVRSRGAVDVIDVSAQAPALLASGPMVLEGARLQVQGFALELSDVIGQTLDWGDRILLRTRRQRLALQMKDDSRDLWSLVLDPALHRMEVAV
jgi:1-acyl-sn-glycerol-3-phosphate acyltransferase